MVRKLVVVSALSLVALAAVLVACPLPSTYCETEMDCPLGYSCWWLDGDEKGMCLLVGELNVGDLEEPAASPDGGHSSGGSGSGSSSGGSGSSGSGSSGGSSSGGGCVPYSLDESFTAIADNCTQIAGAITYVGSDLPVLSPGPCASFVQPAGSLCSSLASHYPIKVGAAGTLTARVSSTETDSAQRFALEAGCEAVGTQGGPLAVQQSLTVSANQIAYVNVRACGNITVTVQLVP